MAPVAIVLPNGLLNVGMSAGSEIESPNRPRRGVLPLPGPAVRYVHTRAQSRSAQSRCVERGAVASKTIPCCVRQEISAVKSAPPSREETWRLARDRLGQYWQEAAQEIQVRLGHQSLRRRTC